MPIGAHAQVAWQGEKAGDTDGLTGQRGRVQRERLLRVDAAS